MSGGLAAAADDPDALYADRRNPASVERAADLWTTQLNDQPQAFDAAWKLARASYWLGGHAQEKDRRRWYRARNRRGAARHRDCRRSTRRTLLDGREHGSAGRIGGTLGGAEVSRHDQAGARNRPADRSGVHVRVGRSRARAMVFQSAAPLWRQQRPRGRASQEVAGVRARDSTVSHFFLAEVLLDENRRDEARRELQSVLDAPFDREWAPEDEDYKLRAQPFGHASLLLAMQARARPAPAVPPIVLSASSVPQAIAENRRRRTGYRLLPPATGTSLEGAAQMTKKRAKFRSVSRRDAVARFLNRAARRRRHDDEPVPHDQR